MKHTSHCLCWPNKCFGVDPGLCRGLLLLVCWYKSAVQAALAASTREVTLFLKIYQKKSSCMPVLRTGWEKMHNQDIATSALQLKSWASQKRWLERMSGGLFSNLTLKAGLVSTKTRSAMALASWVLKTSKDGEATTSPGYPCQCCTTFLSELLPTSSLTFLSQTLFSFTPSFAIY